MQATDLDQAPTPIVCLPVDFDLQTCVSLHLPFLCFVIEHVLVITNTSTVHSVPSCHAFAGKGGRKGKICNGASPADFSKCFLTQ